jgi:hypothetical protein
MLAGEAEGTQVLPRTSDAVSTVVPSGFSRSGLESRTTVHARFVYRSRFKIMVEDIIEVVGLYERWRQMQKCPTYPTGVV